MCDDQKSQKIKGYQAAIALYNVEMQAQWQLRTTFLLVHAVYLGFLLNALVNPKAWANPWLLILACVVGLAFSLLALSADMRMSKTSELRMLGAKRLEEDDWWLLKGPVEQLTYLGYVRSPEYIDELKRYNHGNELKQIGWLDSLLGKQTMQIVFFLFFFSYGGVLLWVVDTSKAFVFTPWSILCGILVLVLVSLIGKMRRLFMKLRDHKERIEELEGQIQNPPTQAHVGTEKT